MAVKEQRAQKGIAKQRPEQDFYIRQANGKAFWISP
jgi:hypothetical protein